MDFHKSNLWWLLVSLNILMSLPTTAKALPSPSFKPPTCEAVLRHAFPDLCELNVKRESITVRGLQLVFWRYNNARQEVTQYKNEDRKMPIVMVHGGPAATHKYMLPLKQQACRGREVVFYDQVGCGESSTPAYARNSAPWLFTMSYYTEELKSLVDYLGWEAFHLFGSSWGTIVVQAYALEHDPRLKGIVLSGPFSDSKLYVRSQWNPTDGSFGSLPLFTQAEIKQFGDTESFKTNEYLDINTFRIMLSTFFTVRTVPTPDCALESLMLFNTSLEIYVGMQGGYAGTEFAMGGVLSTMNLTAELSHIFNPVLLTYGKYDTTRQDTVDALYHNLPRAWKTVMPHSGHWSMVDDPLLMNNVVGDFFDAVDSDSLASFDPSMLAEDWTTGPGGMPMLLAFQYCACLLIGASVGAFGAVRFVMRKSASDSHLLPDSGEEA